MNKKMLVLDIDGTLTNSKKEITAATRNAIADIIDRGHTVVIASGRPTPGIRGVCETLDLYTKGGYGISFNGAKITDMKSGETVYRRTLEKSVIPEIYDYAVSRGVGMMTYKGENAVTGTRIDKYMELEARINGIGLKKVENFKEYVSFDVNKCLLTADGDYAAQIEKELAQKYEGRLSIYRSEPFFVEIMPWGVDKASSLKVLLERLNMSVCDMICCGDGFNDLSMVKYAGVGVAMANAADAVKEAADYVTLSNNDDGIVDVINKFI